MNQRTHARILRAATLLVVPAAALVAADARADVVTDLTTNEVDPSVAYNPEDDEFLVVWESRDTFGGANILGRRYDGSGQPLGNPFGVAVDLAADDRSPAVAFNPLTHGFVVAYVHDDGDADVRVREVPSSSMVVLQPFDVAIADDPGVDETAPQLAFNPVAGTFALTYVHEYSAIDHDIYAVRFSATTGAVSGVALGIATSSADQSAPDIACSPVSAQCRVVFEELSGPGPEGVATRAFDASAGALTSPIASLGREPGAHYAPTIAVDDGGEYLALWEHVGTQDTNVIGVEIASQGQINLFTTVIASSASNEGEPDVAFDPVAEVFRVVWAQDGGTQGSYDVWTRDVSKTGNPDVPHAVATSSRDDVRPAVAAGSSPGMAVWEHIFTPGGFFSPPDTDIHIGAL